MKNFFLITLFFLTIALIPSCDPIQEQEYCELKTEVSAPEGYNIEFYAGIQYQGVLLDLQFTGNNYGYILGRSFNGITNVLKTSDNGLNWDLLETQYYNEPISMLFISEGIGLVSLYGAKGNLLKTIDGGQSWTQKQYDNINGQLYHIQKDEENNLYAVVGVKDPVLVKSTDQAESWTVINSSSQLGFTVASFSFSLYAERIYISGDNGSVVVTDLEGNTLNTLQTTMTDIWDMEVIDYENIVISNKNKVIKTSDGGSTWVTVNDSAARIIGFKSSTNGFLVYNKGFCPTEVYHAYDVIACTKDGGSNWLEGEETSNLINYFANAVPWGSNGFMLLLGNSLFLLDEE